MEVWSVVGRIFSYGNAYCLIWPPLLLQCLFLIDLRSRCWWVAAILQAGANNCSSKICQGRLPTTRIRRVLPSLTDISSVPCKPWKRHATVPQAFAHHLWSRRYLALLDLATSLLLQNRVTPRHTRCRLQKSQSHSSPNAPVESPTYIKTSTIVPVIGTQSHQK